MSAGLDPPPDGMDVEIGHEGVAWTVGARAGAMALAQASFALAAAALGWGTWTGSWSAALALPAVGVGGLFLLQARRRTRVRITDRAIVLEHRSFTGTETVRIPLDELDAVGVTTDRSESGLALRTAEGQVVTGVGRPVEELEWILAAVSAAQEAFGRREQAEGREWRFLRKVPQGLERLRG